MRLVDTSAASSRFVVCILAWLFFPDSCTVFSELTCACLLGCCMPSLLPRVGSFLSCAIFLLLAPAKAGCCCPYWRLQP